jgi:hypothetical protein
MQVRAWVHESVVKKVGAGMPAKIGIDAFPDLDLQGNVTDVASFYDSTRHWLSGGVKEYATLVEIEDIGQANLKPGMTAAVEILVGELSDALIVPIPAVAQRSGQYVSFVVEEQDVTARPVSVGANTSNYVEITDGLREGERVALDARRRISDAVQGNASEESAEDTSRVAAGANSP